MSAIFTKARSLNAIDSWRVFFLQAPLIDWTGYVQLSSQQGPRDGRSYLYTHCRLVSSLRID